MRLKRLPSYLIGLVTKSMVLLAVLLIHGPAWATFAHVQTKSNFTGTSGASSLTVGSGQGWVASTAGNAIIVVCGTHTSNVVPTISDNKSDTYTLVKSIFDSSPSLLSLYILPNNPGGITSIKCTPSAFADTTMMVAEMSGVASVNAADQSASHDNPFGGANPWTSTATAAQTAASDYGLGVAYEFRVTHQTFTAGSGWTGIATDGGGSIFAEEQNPVSGTSAATATGSVTTTHNAQVLALAATFKAPAGVTGPSITSLTPNRGAIGSSIMIAGSGFGATQLSSTAKFNGVTATTVGPWSDGSITVVVPTGATTGSVVVTVNGAASNGSNFTVVPAPNITSLSVVSGPVGASVTISGTNFGATQGAVTFNGLNASISSWTDTRIAAAVPTGATTGNVVVKAAGGVGSTGVQFTVTQTPFINSVSPVSGLLGSSIAINGANFGSTGTVTFNGVPTNPTTTIWGPVQILASVPNGASTGNVVVTTVGGPSNGSPFTVLPPNITSLQPVLASVGATVTISGQGFGTAQGAVTFSASSGTVSAQVISWSGNSIAVSVPGAAVNGNVVVTLPAGVSNGVSFTVLPKITGVQAPAEAVNASVTINGSGFGDLQGASTIAFGTTPATSITSWSKSSIVLAVPGALVGGATNIVITVGGQASNQQAFTVLPGVTSLALHLGPPQVGLVVTGTNFGATQPVGSTVNIGTVVLNISSWSNTSIIAQIPATAPAISGNVVVTLASGQSAQGSNNAFTITPVFGCGLPQ